MKEYIPIDRKEPRFRLSKYRYIVLNRDLFDRFKKENPNLKMDYIVFKDIIGAISERYVDLAIQERDGIYLPAGMGKIQLCMFKVGERQENSYLSKQIGKRITHFDLHSDSMVGKIIWCMDGVKYKTDNTRYYAFFGHRTFKNKASHAFRTVPEFYAREYKMIRKYEFRKLATHYARIEADDQSGDQPGEGTE